MTFIISNHYVYVSSKIVYIALVNWPSRTTVTHIEKRDDPKIKNTHTAKNSNHE